MAGGGGGTFPHVTVKIGQCQEDHTSPHDPQTQPTSIKCNRTFRESHHQASLATSYRDTLRKKLTVKTFADPPEGQKMSEQPSLHKPSSFVTQANTKVSTTLLTHTISGGQPQWLCEIF